MNIAFKYRQTVVQVRANAAHQHMVAVEHQMLRGDGSSQQFVTVTHAPGGVFGGDMFKNHFQAGQALGARGSITVSMSVILRSKISVSA